MAEFRTVHSKMWRDSWFTELDIDGKLLWVYLITNQAASLTGIYHLSVKFAAFETGLSQERINTLLAQFVLSGKIEYENEIIWVRRMRRYQAQNESSPTIKPRIIKDLDEIPECRIKRMYTDAYDTNRVSNCLDRVSVPTHTDTDTETDTDTDTEKETNIGASAPASPRDQLRFNLTPEGALMAQKLRAVCESKGRRATEFYANALQRDAYLTAFSALGSNLERLLDSAMKKDITERGKLLAWLEGCAKKNGNSKSDSGLTKVQRAIQISAQHDAERGRHGNV